MVASIGGLVAGDRLSALDSSYGTVEALAVVDQTATVLEAHLSQR